MVGVHSYLHIMQLVINVVHPLTPVSVHLNQVRAPHGPALPDVTVHQVRRRQVNHVIRFRLSDYSRLYKQLGKSIKKNISFNETLEGLIE